MDPNFMATVDESGFYTITMDDLYFTDLDNGPEEVTFFVSNEVNGDVRVANNPSLDSFTPQDITDGLVVFWQLDPLQSASFDVEVQDGEDTSGLQTFNFTVNEAFMLL